MNIQIFGKNKCFDTKKAERYFKERRIPFQSIDLKRYGMSGKVIGAAVGLGNLPDAPTPHQAAALNLAEVKISPA